MAGSFPTLLSSSLKVILPHDTTYEYSRQPNVAVTLETCMWEVAGVNLRWNDEYRLLTGLSWFSSVQPGK